MLKKLLALFIVCYSLQAYADDFMQSYQAGKDLARQSNEQVLHALDHFQPQTSIPFYTSNPKEKSLYSTDSNADEKLNDATEQEVASNETARSIKDSFLNQPQYKYDEKSLKSSKWILDHANEILSGKCQEVPVCKTEYENLSCNEAPSNRYKQCIQNLSIDVNKQKIEKHYPLTIHLQSDRSYMAAILNAVTGQLIDHGPRHASAWLQGRLPADVDCRSLTGKTLSVSLNGGHITGIDYPSCSTGNSVNIRVEGFGDVGGTVTIDVISTTIKLDLIDHWQEDCDTQVENQICNIKSSSCIDGQGTRVIEGIPVTRDCWSKKTDYMCHGTTNLDNACNDLRSKGCLQTGSVCQKANQYGCQLYKQSFQCPIKECSEEKTYICESHPPCLGENCSIREKQPDKDFNQAAGAFSTLVDAGKQLIGNGSDVYKVFSGVEQSCSKARLGYLNCCKDEGWGAILGAKCSQGEKKLKHDKEKKITVELPGEYCGLESYGICRSWRKRYCVFGSKIARIIQEQGRRDQLHIDFGNAKHPNCSGISPEELQKLDFSKINFSEIADDLKSSINLPSNEAITERIKQRMQELNPPQ